MSLIDRREEQTGSYKLNEGQTDGAACAPVSFTSDRDESRGVNTHNPLFNPYSCLMMKWVVFHLKSAEAWQASDWDFGEERKKCGGKRKRITHKIRITDLCLNTFFFMHVY